MFGRKKSGGKVFVGLSGGVDSAVSAALLQKEGYDVTGVFIRIALDGYPCTAGEDKIEAMRVAAHLQIPFIEIDLSKEYQEEVFQNTISEFKKGRTPNPDTLCNRQIKFGHFYAFAKSQGADFIATGHYAQVKEGELCMGADELKDQSYFLWMVPQEIFKCTLFPVGHLQKHEVRALALKYGLPNAARKDSQGLCFLGPISIEDMLKQELAPTPGEVLDENGAAVGSHDGAELYTLGQRHGFTLFAQSAHAAPYFVVAKDVQHNTITVSTSKFPQNKKRTHIALVETNWIGDIDTAQKFSARFRYRAALIPATLKLDSHGSQASTAILLEPHYVPLGQSLVLYDGERCLGGGSVDSTQLI